MRKRKKYVENRTEIFTIIKVEPQDELQIEKIIIESERKDVNHSSE